MRLAFFDTKPYDIPGFDQYAAPAGIEIKYFESRLNMDTAALAAGFDGKIKCTFVNFEERQSAFSPTKVFSWIIMASFCAFTITKGL